MATNLALDDKLIEEARKVGNHKTKKEAVTTALKEYIAHRKQRDIVGLFGTLKFSEDYDYKSARHR
ncbi:MAG TPA: type II toxin-antitoxin system VapB family antitoxin [Smithellaceae bacterium]|nr:type II toxin-antitoxin system VapB family antitoxin [Smithellaceae bacterium]